MFAKRLDNFEIVDVYKINLIFQWVEYLKFVKNKLWIVKQFTFNPSLNVHS